MPLSFGCLLGFRTPLSVSIYGMLFCYLSSDVLYFFFFLLCPNLNELLVLREEKKKPTLSMYRCVLYVLYQMSPTYVEYEMS